MAQGASQVFLKRLLLGLSAATLSLGLAACSSEPDNSEALEKLDEKLAGADSDPAMNQALDDRILVDPELVDQSNITTVKNAETPLNGQVPADTGYQGDAREAVAQAAAAVAELEGGKMLRAPKPTIVAAKDCKACGEQRATTLGALASDQGVAHSKATCDAKMQYGNAWAGRMPASFPIYPKSRVKEAAGVKGEICNIRAVSFTTSAGMSDVVDWYYSRAKHAGFSAEYQVRAGQHVLGGVRNRDGGAYFITFNRHPGGGTAVDIVANNGN